MELMRCFLLEAAGSSLVLLVVSSSDGDDTDSKASDDDHLHRWQLGSSSCGQARGGTGISVTVPNAP